MLSIQLRNLHFFAYHGLFEQEKKTGNNFELDVDIQVDAPARITSLKHTLDYVTVYEMIEKRMEQPTALLETVAQELVEKIHELDSRVKLVEITIRKLAPPIKNFKGYVGISYKKEF
jgi:7,8-dihydroneopterin aldolase/epimerase/oxygenase